mmetsp:Transcript_2727/g.3671  ORF Transcript_2727/g.3671 Transcript_2727/m.3671 type:complete len:147 (+) Transcript_2727:171-611(+)
MALVKGTFGITRLGTRTKTLSPLYNVRIRALASGGDPRKKGAPPKTAEEKASEKFFLGVLRAGTEDLPPLTAEEKAQGQKLASNYNKMLFKRHNEEQIIINARAVLHRSSIKALPTEELISEAQEPDLRPIPLYRQIARWTPPKAV